MKVNVTSKNAAISEDIIKYAERKVSKLTKYSQRLQTATVMFTEGVSKKRSKSFRAEVALQAPGKTLRSEEEKESFQAALDCALEKLEEQLRRSKTKRLDKTRDRQQTPETPISLVPREEPPALPIYIERFSVKPLSTAEAIASLDVNGREFMLFVNENSVVNCIYRRRDSGYGLLVPEDEVI